MPAIWTLASADTWVLTGTAIAFTVLTAFCDDDGVYDDDGLDCSNLDYARLHPKCCAYLAEGSPNASVRTAFAVITEMGR
jgi:hypothetical protein